MSRIQLNVRIPRSLVGKVRGDARRNRRTVDSVVETIVADFFTGWTAAERSKFYAAQPAKKVGRPLKEEAA